MEVTPNLRRKQAWLCLGVFVFLGLGLAAPNWFLTLGGGPGGHGGGFVCRYYAAGTAGRGAPPLRDYHQFNRRAVRAIKGHRPGGAGHRADRSRFPDREEAGYEAGSFRASWFRG